MTKKGGGYSGGPKSTALSVQKLFWSPIMESRFPKITRIATTCVWVASVLLLLESERPNPRTALAQVPNGRGCPNGWVCAKFVGNQGGCNPHSCCPEGQTYCSGSEYSPHPSEQWAAATSGICIKGSVTENVDWCLISPCQGPTYCMQGGCSAQGGEMTQVPRTVTGVSCPIPES